jgi:AraC-like DNA-binding protein
MAHTATALTSWAKAIRKALESAGHDPKPLFLQAGLDLSALDDPNARYPVESTSRLWRLAVEATGDPAFGLTVASHVTQTTFHALGYSLVASPTLKEAFERLVRYFRIVSDAAELEFKRVAEEYHFIIHIEQNGPRPAFESIDAFLSVNLRMCRALYGRQLSPLRVALQRPAPADTSPFERVFRAPLEFAAPQNLLVFERSAFEQPLEGANPELARHNDQILAQYLARHERQNVAARVHGVLVEQLSLGEPSQQKIADELHMSLRNLQRKLSSEGTSYKDILNETRRELALSYMKDPRYSVSEITYLLGFSDTSSFTRAFRRWTGKSPTAHRATLGLGQP